MKIQMQRKTNLQKIKIIKNGYDGETFYFEEDNKSTDDHKIKLLHIGGFYSVKGQDILLKALELIDLPIKLTLIGIGPELDKCRQFVQGHKLQEKVQFLGQVPHNKIAELIRRNNIFCMPSRSEGLPAAPLEAMACGLPVVGTNVGGMNEIINDGFNGYLCIPESPEDLCNKIVLASNTNWNRNDISEWVKNNYSWNVWAKSIIREHNIISGQYVNC
jgi:glycosyltransferase involved in cell wall biosynthesis